MLCFLALAFNNGSIRHPSTSSTHTHTHTCPPPPRATAATRQLTGCRLDEIGQAMTYYTIDGTHGCQALAGADTDGATHYSFTNSSGISCLKAGCDDECHVCAFSQGNCATLSPTPSPTLSPTHGSGSGSGNPPNHDAFEETLSDQVLTCDTTVSGRTEANGMSYLGNPSPDQLLTLRVATADAFTLNACTSAFSTVLRVFDLEANELKTCTSCECLPCAGTVALPGLCRLLPVLPVAPFADAHGWAVLSVAIAIAVC